MEYVFKTAVEAWSVLYDDLGNSNSTHEIDNFFESQPRGRKCNESIGTTIKILEPQNCLMWSNIRRLSPIYLAKEYMWYLNGDRKVENAPSSVWKGLANEEGADKGLVNSNYGAYIFGQKDNKYPELNVFDATVKLLKEDPDSRQAIWQIPIMSHRQDKDTPCTSSIHFLLRDNKLYCTVYMRSCDIWFGMPNDVTQFIMWQMMLAKALNVELGWYRHVFGSLHTYEENFIKDTEEYFNALNEIYITGNENIPYFKFYDDRNYREILDELIEDFKILCENKKDDIMNNNMLKNEELKFMLNNMQVSSFKH